MLKKSLELFINKYRLIVLFTFGRMLGIRIKGNCILLASLSMCPSLHIEHVPPPPPCFFAFRPLTSLPPRVVHEALLLLFVFLFFLMMR